MRDIKTEIINTPKQIVDLVDWLVLRHASPEPYKTTMYIDLEGVDLCREGSISIFTLLIDTGIPTIRVYLVDVHSLGSQAFNATGIKTEDFNGYPSRREDSKGLFRRSQRFGCFICTF